MKVITTDLEGVFIIDNFFSEDIRGTFTKLYNEKSFCENSLHLEIKEVYYSLSNKDVIRGLHFQKPPLEHNKLVSVINGKVEDVILDLRKESKTYGQYIKYELNSESNQSIYVPIGCAHGFKSLENNTVMMYMVSTCFDEICDSGIRWDSAGIDWNIKDPIVSYKDSNLIELKNFKSPF